MMINKILARPANMDEFFTTQNPECYKPNWRAYYESALERRETLKDKPGFLGGVKYGSNSWQFMNINSPESATNCPIVIYFHGGRWREGHPDFYDWMGDPWVRQGAVFASCGYRLEPEHTIADAIEDMLIALNWLVRNAERFGGDARNIIVSGHSAGGHLAAMAAFTQINEKIDRAGKISGAIIMSGVADISAIAPGYGKELSPAFNIITAPERVVVSYGNPEANRVDADDWDLTRQGELLSNRLRELAYPHSVVALGAMDHVKTAAAFVDEYSPLYAMAQYAIFGNKNFSD